MLLKDFDYDLPKELIATSPVANRDESKLLVANNIDNNFIDDVSSNFVDYIQSGDVVVFNNTKVIPSRFDATCDGVKIEITLHRKQADSSWSAFAKPQRKINIGAIIIIAKDFQCTVIDKNDGEIIVKFSYEENELQKLIDKYGRMPLPPYIEKQRKQKMQATHNESDPENYQTIYAKNIGAVAAPTAGLHFTDALFDKIKAKGANIVFVTLHVGGGTFLPVKCDNIKDHNMHCEYAILTDDAANEINDSKNKGGKVIAIGTTSLRILETAANDDGVLIPFNGETDIFITPGYKFKIIDKLFTNFHMPKSTLFMLVSAFLSLDKMKETYDHAIEKKYRFFSYGDASLLIKK